MNRNMERSKTFKRLVGEMVRRPDHTVCSEEMDVVSMRDRSYLDRMVEAGYCWAEEDMDGVRMWVLRPYLAIYYGENPQRLH